MIRFVDIRGQGTGYRFAFWDTVTDRFCQFDGDQAWDTKAEFVKWYDGLDLPRYVSLMPEWTEIDEPDNDF